MKLKLSKPTDPNAPPSVPPTPSAQTPGGASTSTGGGGGFKLKLKSSQPPTPVGEAAPAPSSSQPSQPILPPPPPPKRAYNKKPKPTSDDLKRPAQDDISPAPKRPTVNTAPRKFSIKVGDSNAPTPAAARLKLSARKQSIGPKTISIVSRKIPPKRPVGVGYDSEASDAEEDPAIEHQFILRMEPGKDCEYLRQAIANKTLGDKPDAGGAYVNMRFLDKELRRAIVHVDKTMYAAVMVDLPCVVEGMKSWDKRGWWKVADICQMLLVLGPTLDEGSAKTTPLPREVDKHTFAYAHGLTPPMHWVRKRRFRKRASYKTIEHVDDEVERLLKADEAAEKAGGDVKWDVVDENAQQRQAEAEAEQEDLLLQDQEYYDEEEPTQFLDSTEDSFGQAMVAEPAEEEDDGSLADMLGAALEEADDTEDPIPSSASAVLPAALPPTDHALTLAAVENTVIQAAAATTTAEQEEAAEEEEGSSDEDSDSSSASASAASPTTIDEDLVAEQQQKAQVLEEIADLEREVQNARVNIERTKNPMLRQRAVNALRSLEDELGMKRRNFGLEEDDDDDDEDGEGG